MSKYHIETIQKEIMTMSVYVSTFKNVDEHNKCTLGWALFKITYFKVCLLYLQYAFYRYIY